MIERNMRSIRAGTTALLLILAGALAVVFAYTASDRGTGLEGGNAHASFDPELGTRAPSLDTNRANTSGSALRAPAKRNSFRVLGRTLCRTSKLPVAALISVGNRSTRSRPSDGFFAIEIAEGEHLFLTANGYKPLECEARPPEMPATLLLEPAHVLSIKVVNDVGTPIGGASVFSASDGRLPRSRGGEHNVRLGTTGLDGTFDIPYGRPIPVFAQSGSMSSSVSIPRSEDGTCLLRVSQAETASLGLGSPDTPFTGRITLRGSCEEQDYTLVAEASDKSPAGPLPAGTYRIAIEEPRTCRLVAANLSEVAYPIPGGTTTWLPATPLPGVTLEVRDDTSDQLLDDGMATLVADDNGEPLVLASASQFSHGLINIAGVLDCKALRQGAPCTLIVGARDHDDFVISDVLASFANRDRFTIRLHISPRGKLLARSGDASYTDALCVTECAYGGDKVDLISRRVFLGYPHEDGSIALSVSLAKFYSIRSAMGGTVQPIAPVLAIVKPSDWVAGQAQVNLPKLGTIVVKKPEDCVADLACSDRSGSILVEALQGERELEFRVLPGSYRVGPRDSVGKELLPEEANWEVVEVGSGERRLVNWKESWAPVDRLTGRVTCRGVSPENVVILPATSSRPAGWLWGHATTPDSDGRYELRNLSQQPLWIVAGARSASGDFVPGAIARPGQPLDVDVRSVSLRFARPVPHTEVTVVIEVPLWTDGRMWSQSIVMRSQSASSLNLGRIPRSVGQLRYLSGKRSGTIALPSLSEGELTVDVDL